MLDRENFVLSSQPLGIAGSLSDVAVSDMVAIALELPSTVGGRAAEHRLLEAVLWTLRPSTDSDVNK